MATVVGAATKSFIHRLGDGRVVPAGYTDVTGVTTGADTITGQSQDDIIYGDAGNDTIDGGAGADEMIGGAGDDIYIVDNVNDKVTEVAGEGTDTVQSSISWTLGAELERLVLTGTARINGTGNALNNLITGNANANTLNGGVGADTMTGGLGDDTYIVDNIGDIVVEAANGGIDTVRSSVTYTLASEVENLTLIGSAAINATGNALNNTLIGNSAVNVLSGGAGDDRLDGDAGADTMTGGAGNDRYFVDNAGDLTVELANGGIDTVESRISWTLSAEVENLVLAGISSINGTGNALDNVITGTIGVNVLAGGAGNDTLDGGAGADTLSGGAGDDTYVVDNSGDTVIEAANGGTDTVRSSVSWTLGSDVENLTLLGSAGLSGTGNALNNIIIGNSGKNTLSGGAGNDTLDGSTGADAMTGGAGDDTFVVDDKGDTTVEAAGGGTDTVRSSITWTLGSEIERLVLTGSNATNGTGNALDNTLTGNTGNNTLNGGVGADTMAGGLGNDIYVVDNAGDIVTEAASAGTDRVLAGISYALTANVEQLVLTGTTAINGTGNALANALTGNTAANILDGGAGADTMTGGKGDDTYVVDNVGDKVLESLNEGIDTVQASVDHRLAANIENLVLTGSGSIYAIGNTLNNTITGNAGANYINGGAGIDTMAGGAGDDTYLVDDVGDVVVEAANAGTDSVQSSVSYTLGANVERLVLTGTVGINGTGNALDNTLTGNAAANILNGGAGADAMTGGKGDDTYVVDNAGDTTVELAGGGTDTVQSSISWTLAAEIEKLVLTGTAAIDGTGNALANTLTGNSGANTLDGGAGADSMAGGAGNDLYIVDNVGDKITEISTGGIDSVQSSVSFALFSNVENLTLTGSAAIDGSGNKLNNTLVGNSGNNTLNGAGGADTMAGGAGDDTYVVDNVGDTTVELANNGVDTVQSSISWTLADNIERLVLTGALSIDGTGNALANTLTGNSRNNILNGGAGADTMTGGAGDDTYVVDNAGDVVVELAKGGTDTVQSSIDYVLGAEVERLQLTGTTAINGTGNALANALLGNSAANTLDGGAGADTMTGGAGDDTYIVDHVKDQVIEAANGGTDTVRASISIQLAANVETLVLTGTSAINGTGNALANSLIGNSAANRLDGGAGADTMTGGDGDDIYVVDNAGDMTVELANGGTDTVQSSIGWTLAGNIERLVLTGSLSINGTGNALDNSLTGNSGNNILDGGVGADTMTGGAGHDTYIVDNVGDTTIEAANGGNDTVQSSITWTLANEIEKLVLTGTAAINGTGNALANTLTGNSGANTLNGGAGGDAMAGGAGNDTYVVDNAGDTVIEAANGGVDTVQASVSWALSAEVENLVLTGSSAINGTGNSLANAIIGNSAANVLDGGAGADTLTGGLGNDTYIVDNVGDTVIEAANGGTDTVVSSISWTIGSEIENLTLSGSAAINGTGNLLANILTGNSGRNILNGGLGADTMIGGAGNDTYVVDHSGDTTVETAGGGTDTVEASLSWTLGAEVENLTLTGTSAINGTGNALGNVIIGNDGNNTLVGGAGRDTVSGGAGNDTLSILATTDVAFGDSYDGGAGTDTLFGAAMGSAVDLSTSTIANIESLSGFAGGVQLKASQLDGFTTAVQTGAITLTSSGLVDLTDASVATSVFTLSSVGNTLKLKDDGLAGYTINGGAKADTITIEAGTGTRAHVLNGGGGNDTITGGAGADTIDGGTGNDILTGGLGADRFLFNTSSGSDTIADFNALDGGAAEGDLIAISAALVGTFAYVGADAFSGGSDNSEARISGNKVLIDIDGNGVADITVTLTGLTDAAQLSASDFLFL
ncbi:hypothetical protein [Ensifer soli]|uniref:hypothetical protein n=1 Tax=Ciceribacter sp. sgz301302 TaxID=3342379 RepID=UPI0035B9BA3F